MPFYARDAVNRLPDNDRNRLLRTTLPVGRSASNGDEFLVPLTDRYAGTYVIGIQGSGKSSLLENQIEHDIICGNAVVVIDPHGDLADHTLAALPDAALPRTYILDMTDEEYPFGVNIFGEGMARTAVESSQKIARVNGVFEAVWDDILNQAYLPRYLRAAVICLLAADATLVEMKDFLVDDAFRAQLLTKLQSFDDVRHFWEHEYTQLSTAERMQRVQPLIGRLESLFLGRPLMRNILGQRKTTIDFRRLIDQRAVILIKLPIRLLGDDARLLGTVLVSQLHAAIFSYANVPEAQRPGLSLYVDEFQNFATGAFSELFSEGRKFGARVTVAHQYRSQLPGYLQESTKTARTKICFQLTADDAREMAHYYPVADSVILPQDIEPKPIDWLEKHGCSDNTVERFIATYVRPLDAYRHHGKIEIQAQQLTWHVWDGLQMRELDVEDPTIYLNPFLRTVMQTGAANVPIPHEAVLGFANEGHGFFQQAKRPGKYLLPDITWPPYLVAPVADGYRWIQAPRNSREQLLHFIFHLRHVMGHLAKHPIGKHTETTTTDVAQKLSSLPKRTLYIRCGDDIELLNTHDAPTPVDAQKVGGRHMQVLAQTRAAFCSPREDVERMLGRHAAQPTPTPVQTPPVPNVQPAQPRSRWQNVK